MKPKLILINPWIYDFAAYDLWSKPLGLLYLASFLRESGFDIKLIDCLDVHHPRMKKNPKTNQPVRRAYGIGKFWRKKIMPPDSLKHIDRTYSRYGITKQLFIEELKEVQAPKAILVTSLMTYWYPGVVEVIKIARKVHPDVPIILGGIYARLCKEHALKYSGADQVAYEVGINDFENIINILELFGVNSKSDFSKSNGFFYPAFDLLHELEYICISTSIGCPYRCKYCASNFLNPKFIRRVPDEVVDEILFWREECEIKDFAFYDDALLINSDNHIKIIINELLRHNLDIRFHTPNALHVREITRDMAELLFRAGFKTIRLGLETSDIDQHKTLDKKVSKGEFEKAVNNLKTAGFQPKDIGAYILMGLPGQSVESVKTTLDFVGELKVSPYLAEYSPLPNTELWDEAVRASTYDLSSEPLFHNNSLIPCWDETQKQKVPELRKLVKKIRQDLQ